MFSFQLQDKPRQQSEASLWYPGRCFHRSFICQLSVSRLPFSSWRRFSSSFCHIGSPHSQPDNFSPPSKSHFLFLFLLWAAHRPDSVASSSSLLLVAPRPAPSIILFLLSLVWERWPSCSESSPPWQLLHVPPAFCCLSVAPVYLNSLSLLIPPQQANLILSPPRPAPFVSHHFTFSLLLHTPATFTVFTATI